MELRQVNMKLPITRLATSANLTLLIAGSLACVWSRFSARELGEWGLPLDLCDHPGITELALPAVVDRVDWLPDAVKILEIDHSQVVDLSHLPVGLEELSASYTGVHVLEDLPPFLRALDVTTTELHDIGTLPPGLTQLRMGSTRIGDINALPPSLEELSIDGAILADLRRLPQTLKTLALKGTGIENLEGIPRSLRSLSLAGTRVKSLGGLPSTLESLELSGNAQLAIDYLPARLSRLIIDQATIPDLTPLKSLDDLEATQAVPDRTSRMPQSITALRLRDLPAEPIRFPPDLRALALVGPTRCSFRSGELPRSLESLVLESCPDSQIRLEGMDSLHELSLHFSRVSDFTSLPAGLLSLDLSGTQIQALPSLPVALRALRLRWSRVKQLPPLPPELRILDLRQSSGIATIPATLPGHLEVMLLGSTSVASLPALPVHLKVLDISNTRINNLMLIGGGLPATLEELRLSPRQIKVLGSVPRTLRCLRFIDHGD
jgi:Leucine-rich repeat (LRR) protein